MPNESLVAPWDGLPLNPERNGWHWVSGTDDAAAPFHWNAERRTWWVMDETPPWQMRAFTYRGPCLTPSEVAEHTQRAVAAERERCARIAEDMPDNFALNGGEVAACNMIVAAIRSTTP